MTRKVHPHTQDSPVPADAAVPDEQGDPGEIIERPDGYYWQAPDGRAEVGPFESYETAQADRDAVGDERPDSSETLREAEGDIGINEWIDAETGEPAEGQSPPHLELE